MAKYRKKPVVMADPLEILAHLLGGLRSGWTCPACGKGNAPGVKGCVHCAQVTITCRPPWNTDESGRAGDMDPGD